MKSTFVIIGAGLLSITLTTVCQAACTAGQSTTLAQSMSVIPCGKFDAEKRKCTDTTETTLQEKTPVHITEIKKNRAEVYIGMIPTKTGERYINKFAFVDLGKGGKTLACEN